MTFFTRPKNRITRAADNPKRAVAVIDAATVHGASRWYRRIHSEEKWEFSKVYRAVEDKLLFEEFLHDLMFYDSILLDQSCAVSKISNEFKDFFSLINTRVGFELIRTDRIAPTFTIQAVVQHICSLLARGTSNPAMEQTLLSVSIPSYYFAHDHYDRPVFNRSADSFGLNPLLIPAAIFLYRGICYSGYANSYHRERGIPAVYLASPGRLRVLQPILSASAMEQANFPHREYRDLVDLLGLPSAGYDFSSLEVSRASDLSRLTIAVADKEPEAALEYTLELRSKPKSSDVRSIWADRIWRSSWSAAVGTSHPGAALTNSTVYGNVTQIIHAQARNG